MPQLLAITIGPVQEFIAAARRTRDLWLGSHLLSEISKAAAKAVADQGGKLIFPAPESAADLDPGSPFNVANVILAELSDLDPGIIAAAAKCAARSRWHAFADAVHCSHAGAIRDDIWSDQVEDVVEFYAAWRPFSPEAYKADRAALMRLLGARKQCRDFLPAQGRAGVPKSSLDGLRESVLRKPREWPERLGWQMRLQEGEQLDVVGAVKRAWNPDQGWLRYPSVARIAADPWLRSIPPERLQALAQACKDLPSDVIHGIDAKAHRQYAAFPYEGTVLFRSRHRDIRKECGISETDWRPLAQALDQLSRDYGEPSPYLGVLVADGDQMGQALAALAAPDQHRTFSQALARFAAAARTVIHSHQGVLVYAGGDDVLAFVPVDCVVRCARALYDNFKADGEGRTLSVGVAVAHFMEPLEDLLGYGRAAKKDAKQDRDALAVHVVKRGGAPLRVREGWASDPDKGLQQLAGWLQTGAVSARLAYELHGLAAVYDHWQGSAAEAIRRDALRLFGRKQPRGQSKVAELGKVMEERVKDAASLRNFAVDLLIAKALTAMEPKAASVQSTGAGAP